MSAAGWVEKLDTIADAATIGPWQAFIRNDVGQMLGSVGGPDRLTAWGHIRPADATFIATFDPPTVKAMLAVVQAADVMDLDELERAVVALREAVGG